MQAYLFQGGKKKRGNLLQALAIIEFTSYQRPDSELGKIAEVSSGYVFSSLPFHPIKSSLGFFLAETIHACLKTYSKDLHIYEFLTDEIKAIDQEQVQANYLIWFLLSFSKVLGIQPICDTDSPKILDLKEGVFSSAIAIGSDYAQHEGIEKMAHMLTISRTEALNLPIVKSIRQESLSTLLRYYHYHIDGFQTPKSLSVLQTIFD